METKIKDGWFPMSWQAECLGKGHSSTTCASFRLCKGGHGALASVLIDDDIVTLSTMLDLSAAFGTVDHILVFERLKISFGIDAVVLGPLLFVMCVYPLRMFLYKIISVPPLMLS